MIDFVQEIIANIGANRLRTGLAAMAVAWGVFMLLVILAVGQGIQKGVENDFQDDATNTIWIFGGNTSIATKGHPIGRSIYLTNDDFDAIQKSIPGLEHLIGQVRLLGSFTVGYGKRRAAFDVRGCHPEHQFFERTIVTKGRFLNALDITQLRKNAVLGTHAANVLFEDSDPVGKMIDIAGIFYKVVGVFHDEGSNREIRKIYIPVTTAQAAFRRGKFLDQIVAMIHPSQIENSKHIESQIRKVLAKRHQFAGQDPSAIRIRNNLEYFGRIDAVFVYLEWFIWVVGIGSLLAGVVGIGNIMRISVHERKREFGIRMALGAAPASILRLVVGESLVVTVFSGAFGLLLALLLILALGQWLPEDSFLREPHISLWMGIATFACLVFSGVFTGFFPAKRASQIHPVMALREE